MSEIRDKGIEKMLQIIRHAFSPENAIKRMFSEVTGLTFVDREAELPSFYVPLSYGKLYTISEYRTILLKAGWVKEIKQC